MKVKVGMLLKSIFYDILIIADYPEGDKKQKETHCFKLYTEINTQQVIVNRNVRTIDFNEKLLDEFVDYPVVAFSLRKKDSFLSLSSTMELFIEVPDNSIGCLVKSIFKENEEYHKKEQIENIKSNISYKRECLKAYKLDLKELKNKTKEIQTDIDIAKKVLVELNNE